jgi:microcin C transport system permease protein
MQRDLMLAYFLKRLALIVPTLLGILFLNFLLIQFVPGGPIERILAQEEGFSDSLSQLSGDVKAPPSGRSAETASMTQKVMKALQKQYGFDKPFWERFRLMIAQYLHFDLGESYFRGKRVLQLIRESLPVSISLGFWSILFIYLISIPIGILKAVRHGTRFDFWSSFFVILGYALPTFLVAVFLILFFAGGSFFSWFPLRGLTSEKWHLLSWGQKIRDYAWHMTLPLLTQVISGFASLTLLTKNAFLEEVKKQYVTTARAKGCTEKRILFKHIFQNAVLVLISGFPHAFLHVFFTGSLLVEITFSLNGLGLLGFNAMIARDYPVIFGTLYIFTLVSLFTHLLGDLLYMKADPRITFGRMRK